MMNRKVKWISPVGAANVVALILGATALLFICIFVAGSAIERLFSSPPHTFGLSAGESIVFLVLPFAYVAFGWVQGFIAALMFNLAAKLTGGIRVEIEEV